MQDLEIDAIKNRELKTWLTRVFSLCAPKKMVLIEGGKREYDALAAQLVEEGVLTALNPVKRPDSYLARSAPEDVARVESRTFICSAREEDAGPTNHWQEPYAMREKLEAFFDGAMQGRVCFVVPFCMGPLQSPLAKIGVQITDSAYVALNTHLMARMGRPVWDLLVSGARSFIPCWHSVGVPLQEGEKGPVWPCNPEDLVVAHFPQEKEIWSYGSGYGGNALLGKKCLALRIASVMAREEGWLAEHMLIMGLRSPQGEKKYIAAAFPSACGKTNLAMLQSPLEGWEVECVGDDIAWIYFDQQGRMRAVNPEAGFFGVAPGTSEATNPVAMATIAEHALFTNVASTEQGDVWWEGLDLPQGTITDWKGKVWDRRNPAAHPNARFTAAIESCPIVDEAWDDPEGVVIEAIVFGGRRSRGMPLVMQAPTWEHAVLFGAALSSEKTAAATGNLGELRHDPFAMLPFCGYHMGDYFDHWLSLEKPGRKMPAVFYVNWFGRGEDGSFLWPGFGENIRVLQWVFERCLREGGEAIASPLGLLPSSEQLDLEGLDLSEEAQEKLFCLDREHWRQELKLVKDYFELFGEKMPPRLLHLVTRLLDDLS